MNHSADRRTQHDQGPRPSRGARPIVTAQRVMLAAVLSLAALLLLPAPASGHASAAGSTPAADEVVQSAPSEVRIEFDSGLLEMGSALIVRDADGRSITTGPAVVSDREFSVPVDPKAPPGVYEVAYRVVSADGHTVEETFSYTVSDGTSSATAVTTSTEPSDSPGLPLGWLLAGGVIVIIAVGAALLWRR